MNESVQASIRAAADALAGARRVAVLSGAGMSAASGLPTYRGIGGLYNAIEIEQGMPIEDILHAYTLARDPALCWKYIARIDAACRAAGPNDGHRILAAWDKRFELYVFTQNVDGFHRAAGSQRVIELHGNLACMYCLDCGTRVPSNTVDLNALPPRCAQCDGLMRPDAVLFGEMLPAPALATYEAELARGFDVMFAIGTTAGFPYIQDPVIAAGQRGVTTIEINPDDTPLSAAVSLRITAPADFALAAIEQALNASR